MKHFTIKQNGVDVTSFFCDKYNYDKETNSYIFEFTQHDQLIVSNYGTIIKVSPAENEMERLQKIAEFTLREK